VVQSLARAVGAHRVVEPPGVLPQAAWRLDATSPIGPDEVSVRVRRLNLDAASFRQLREKHGGDGAGVRDEVAGIIGVRGKMHNPVTGSGGMFVGVVEDVGPESPLGLRVGDRIASLVSLTLTPLVLHDGLAAWDGRSEQVPCDANAILFARSVAAVLPDDLPEELAMAVADVCGAPALTARVVDEHRSPQPTVAVLGGAGKSGSLSLAAARRAGARRTLAVVPTRAEAAEVRAAQLADEVLVADARDPLALGSGVRSVFEHGADVTVVCVDVPGCEHGAVLATADRGSVVFFSMATSFSAAALGAEGLAADVTLLVGNGYSHGHAAHAFDLVRTDPRLSAHLASRIGGAHR
jgi:L-erythro-3,5-diaminohexanoate dehydrogenase